MPNISSQSKDYSTLRRKVEETFLIGQKKIEEAKVQTYWLTGKLINDHILKNRSRSQHYGEEVVANLSKDLNISRDVLWRCIKFSKSFKKIVVAPQQSSLTWTHYTKLITVTDEKIRNSLTQRAAKSQWSSDYLAQKIDEETDSSPNKDKDRPHIAYAKLIARKGELYTYRLIETDPLHKKSSDGLRIDMGFKIHQQLPDGVKNLKVGAIIETTKSQTTQDYTVNASTRKDKDLFTYTAFVERVVDGDTLYVEVDLGFKSGTFQYLRLRGINCPEMDTPEGKKAKAFVERELAQVPYIILTSSRSDKYDRYLTDVWIPNAKGDVYLNQKLLDEGLAERME